MAIRRRLLSVGNRKLGEVVAHFDLPALSTCPGRTAACSSACYATKRWYRTRAVKRRLAWLLRQSRSAGFAGKLVREIRERGFTHVRWHASGDIYSEGYARRMLAAMRASPRVVFWLYTRSFIVPSILPVLAEMAALPNCVVWFSLDRDSVVPDSLPEGVRTCWMQDDERPVPLADLVFRTRRMIGLPMVGAASPVCPAETAAGKRAGVNCGSCQSCFAD
jgi:hypothetical protein